MLKPLNGWSSPISKATSIFQGGPPSSYTNYWIFFKTSRLSPELRQPLSKAQIMFSLRLLREKRANQAETYFQLSTQLATNLTLPSNSLSCATPKLQRKGGNIGGQVSEDSSVENTATFPYYSILIRLVSSCPLISLCQISQGKLLTPIGKYVNQCYYTQNIQVLLSGYSRSNLGK